MQATFEISEFSLIAKHSEHKKKKIKVTLTIFHILCNSFLLFLSSGPRFSSSILIFRKKPTLNYVDQPRYQSKTAHTLLWKYMQMKLTFVWENFAHGRTLKWKVNCTRKWLRYFVMWNVWMQTGWHIKEHKEDCTAEFAVCKHRAFNLQGYCSCKSVRHNRDKVLCCTKSSDTFVAIQTAQWRCPLTRGKCFLIKQFC